MLESGEIYFTNFESKTHIFIGHIYWKSLYFCVMPQYMYIMTVNSAICSMDGPHRSEQGFLFWM